MTRITVLGGTGYAGAAIVRAAAQRGHEVTSVSRSEPAERVDGVTYVVGSALDPAVLDDAVAGRDVVVSAVSPRGDMAGRVEGLLDDLIARAVAGGVRVGVIGGASSLLVSEGGPRHYDVAEFPPEVKPEVETGLALLETLRAAPAELDWFYVSPPEQFGSWIDAPEKGEYQLGEDILLRDAEGNSVISAADLALAVVDEIEQPRFRRRRFTVAH